MTPQPQVLPDSESSALARSSAEELSRLLCQMPETERARVQLDGNDLVLPRQALALLRDLLVEMAQGNAVTIVPTHAELTTQEAANILNVSRPHLVKLLEEGVIPFSRTGTHRRIRYQDLMSYRAQRNQESKAALDELVSEAQDHDMGY
ncbi:MAG: DNA-binding protein [Sedimenticola sp.]|nr:MAG: DNA-binding protein [Sedimenticola sp.]